MATRNILDNQGNTIGAVTLPDSTTEAQWTEVLAMYAQSPIVPAAAPCLKTTVVTGSGNVTTSSATATTVGSMSISPESGTYLAQFSGSIYTGGASATGEFGIYVDGVLVTETRRDISCNLTLLGGLVTISLNSIGVGTNTASRIILNGSQTIDVKFRSTNGGTIGFSDRVFVLMRVA